MKHYIKDNIYYLENSKGEIVLTISLYEEKLQGLDQVQIKTKDEVYNGPIEFFLFADAVLMDDIDLIK